MPSRLLELRVENFRSLRDVTVPLGPLTVLVGPNGVGKSNVLKVFDFLADIIRTDLQPALDVRGGFDEVAFWGGNKPPTFMRVQLKATWTSNSTLNAPDQYSLTIRRRSLPANRDSSRAAYTLSREESFAFKRTQGRGRRITISGEEARVVDRRAGKEEGAGRFGIRRLSSGLSTLPRLGPADGGDEVTRVAERLSSLRCRGAQELVSTRVPEGVPGSHECRQVSSVLSARVFRERMAGTFTAPAGLRERVKVPCPVHGARRQPDPSTHTRSPASPVSAVGGVFRHFLRSAPGRIRTCAHGSGGRCSIP